MESNPCNPQAKILWHLDRVKEWQDTGSTSPLLFEIDPSNKCNQDCPWCAFSKLRSESNSMLCWGTIKNLLDDLKSMGVKAINWSGGGEPLVNVHTVEAIRYAKDLGFDQGIFTNGLLLKKEKADAMAKNMTWIRISLDGYDKKSYAQSHGTSEKCFEQVIENARYLCSIKDRCTVGIGFIITEENYMGIKKVARIAHNIGADYVQFKPVTYRPYEEQISSTLVKEEFVPRVIEAKKRYADENFKVITTDYRFQDVINKKDNYGRNYKRCLSHGFLGVVGGDSKVYFCDHHKGEKDYELGDLKENTMEEIWNSDQRKKVVDFVDSTDLSQCQICCRNHELNKFLWHIQHEEDRTHPNHI
jgi:MoaA/NifB/PqqE/SkfB family radical SAM enzyme